MSDISLPTGDKKIDEQNWGNYKNPGDIYNMRFHDFFGTLLFLIFFICLIVILVFGIKRGKLWALFRSWDESGNYCGVNNTQLTDSIQNYNSSIFTLRDFSDYPLLFFGAPRKIGDQREGAGKIQYCVKTCPTAPDFKLALSDSCEDSTRICPSYFTETQRASESKKGGKCICPYPTKPIFNRCVPVIDELITSKFSEFFDEVNQILDFIPSVSQSINTCTKLWLPILVAPFFSILVAFLFIYLLRYCSCFMVYFMCFMFPLIFIGFGVLLYIYGDYAFHIGNNSYHKYLSYILWGIGGILILIVIFLIGKLKKTIEIIEISSRASINNIISLFAPIVSLVLSIIFYAFIFLSSVLNYTSSDFLIKTKNDQPYMGYSFDETLKYFLLYNLVYAVFISVQLYFANYYATSASVVWWYFNQNTTCMCNCTCFYGFFLAFTKSLGTITISTLIVTPLDLLILILGFIERKAKKESTSISKFVVILAKCLACCLICFERFLRYVQRMLFTVSQVYNSSWYRSIKISSEVVFSDILLTAAVNGISGFVIFSSKVVSSGLNTLLFFLYIKYGIKEVIHSWLLSLFIVFIFSFLISSFVFGMLNNVIDIIFVCYQSDVSLTKGGTEREMFIKTDSKILIESMKQLETNKETSED